jgi:muramoyltetrapeptide carboxypeptidase
MLASLCGSSSQLSADGRILFLEDIDEPAYRVDRMLVQLERAGSLKGIVGLALGRFCKTPDIKQTTLTVLTQFAERVGVPTVAELPFGHTEHNCTLPVGACARLDAEAGVLEIVEGGVEATSVTSDDT